MEYLPGAGNHYFNYKGRNMWAVSTEGETMVTGWERKAEKQEILYISMYGKDTAPLRQLVSDAIDFAAEEDSNLTNIYDVHRWGIGWEKKH